MSNCKVCGKDFEPRFYNEKTCSDECKFINQKKDSLEWKKNNKTHLKESYKIKAKKYYERHKEKFIGNKDGFIEKVRSYTHANFEKDSECHFCATKDNLDFHHKVYEYPPSPLQVLTLCRRCHLKLHALIDSVSAEKDRMIQEGSHSRDFWKSEAIRLKKEKAEFEGSFNTLPEHAIKCPVCFKAGQDSLKSQLREKIKDKFAGYNLIKKEKVLELLEEK